jgi:hypothetical protein
MYSMVLMAAMMPAGDTASFGKHKYGCTGGCTGTPVVVATGCSGGCTGGCHGGHGFLGLRSSGCTGCHGGGFLGLHKHGCTGSYTPVYGCTGYTPVYGCTGGVVVPTAPEPAKMDPKKDPAKP